MRTRLGQAAVETIIIFSISSVIVLILLNAGLQSQSATSDALRISQARTTVNVLTSAAEEVWSQGPGATSRLIIIVPSEVNETESGILGGKTVRYRVLTRGDFTDVSEVSEVNITGTLPTFGGEYEVILTSRENDVLLSVIQSLLVVTDKSVYCEGEMVYYYVTALDEQGLGRDSNVTIQLLDTSSVVRDEQNKTTIGGLTNGTFTIPTLSDYGDWKVSAFDNVTSDYQNIYVANCNGTGTTNLSITTCHAFPTNLSLGESSNLACWVSSANPIDTVLYTVSSTQYNAFPDGASWWNVTWNCTSPGYYTWTSAWANDTLGYTQSTTSNGLPITLNCTAVGNPPIINYTTANDTLIDQYETICINATATDLDDNIDDVWVVITTPNSSSINVSLSDTGAWCAGTSGDDVYGVEVQLNSYGTYTLVAGWVNDTTSNYDNDPVNIDIQVSEDFEFTENDVYINFPDATTKNRETNHSFMICNNNSVDLSYIYEVKEIWDHGWSSGEFCTLVSPPDANFTCICDASGRQCNATWNGVFPISPQNFTIFSYSFDNSGLDDLGIEATVQFKVVNSTTITKSRWLDFIQNVPTAEVYLSKDKINWAMGINYVNADELTTIYVQLVEEGNKGGTQITNPTVKSLLPKTWTNLTIANGTITDLGDYWELSWNTGDIPYGDNRIFNFTGITPNSTGLTRLSTTINSSDPTEYINATNIHELGIRVVEGCTNHSDCNSGEYCATGGVCLTQKSVGGMCDESVVYDSLDQNRVCSSDYCREDYLGDWYCVADSNDCSEAGATRDNGYVACINSSTSITCNAGVWVNQTTCSTSYQGCDTNSTKATYCGWQTIGGSCVVSSGCGSGTGSCNDCGSFYEDSPFSSCSYTNGLSYCDEGCGATCDEATDYYFNDAGDQCSYSCNNSCTWGSIDACGDPGDLYGTTCFYGTNGCDQTGCTTSSETCNTYCLNDFDGGSCTTSRTNPSSNDTCYYNRACLTTGCNLSSADNLRQDYCDYCTSGGGVTGDYSPSYDVCSSSCPNSGTRYYDDTSSRSDDCDGSGNTQILSESYQLGYTYPSATSAGACDDTECNSDCGIQSGYCSAGTCTCTTLSNTTVFFEDFNPTPYYNYNWSRQGTDWDSKNNLNCYSSGGCAHADGQCSEANDWIVTNNGLLDLSGSNNVYVDFYVREDTSFDPGDYFRVWCWSGSSWIKIYEEDGGDWNNNGNWLHRYTTAHSSCFNSDARFKITIISNQNQEDVFVDDFRVIKEA